MPLKKARVEILVGSLIEHPFRYITKADMKISPRDPTGVAFCNHLYKMTLHMSRKYMQKEFNATYKLDMSLHNCHLQVTFINGWYVDWVVSNMKTNNFNANLKFYNYLIESQRNMQGYDDEPEDEEKIL